ncbi:tyrosine-type recombinase/integrase [Microbacterium sp. Leaf151]|uniref:tyrosine-type recombinase/integrase n=1 Tax=Microbacterium sp. Leaf151 TaxID=1736276 RepID=UPI00138EE648|nr:tyrosine-type recombinase/integrase [Microbacterium sp. Leaf151]
MSDPTPSKHAATNRRPRTAPNGAGSLFQTERRLQSGEVKRTWKRVQDVLLNNGETVRVTGEGATAAEATTRWNNNLIRKQVAAGQADPAAMPLKRAERAMKMRVLMDLWLDAKTPQKLQEGSRAGYESKIRHYINPYFGETPIRHLRAQELERHFTHTLPAVRKKDGSRKLGDTFIRSVYWIMSAAFTWAVDKQHLDRNPLAGVQAPQRTQKSPEKIEDLVSAIADDVPQRVFAGIHNAPDEARWALALFGMRQGEVLGLTDSCIRFGRGARPKNAELVWEDGRRDEAFIIVHQQLSRHWQRHGCGEYDAKMRRWPCKKRSADECTMPQGEAGQYIKPITKTKAGKREIPLIEPLYSILKRHHEEQVVRRASPAFKPLIGMETLLFTSRSGRPKKEVIDRNQWRRLLKDLGVTQDLRLHDARHLAVTLLDGMGVPPILIQRIVGWSEETLDQMLANYSHQTGEVVRDPLEKFAKTLSSGLSNEAKLKLLQDQDRQRSLFSQ